MTFLYLPLLLSCFYCSFCVVFSIWPICLQWWPSSDHVEASSMLVINHRDWKGDQNWQEFETFTVFCPAEHRVLPSTSSNYSFFANVSCTFLINVLEKVVFWNVSHSSCIFLKDNCFRGTMLSRNSETLLRLRFPWPNNKLWLCQAFGTPLDLTADE